MIECNVNNISKTFGADLIFENISFDIKSNERIGLIGPNGSGKTTIIKILYGLEHVQSGSISFRKGRGFRTKDRGGTVHQRGCGRRR